MPVLFEGGEFIVETGGGVDVRGREKRRRDGAFITDTTWKRIAKVTAGRQKVETVALGVGFCAPIYKLC